MYSQQLYYSMKGLKKAWKRLLVVYPTSEHGWEYHKYLAMYYGDAPLNLEEVTEAVKKCKPVMTSTMPKRGLVDQNKYECGVLFVPGLEAEGRRSNLMA